MSFEQYFSVALTRIPFEEDSGGNLSWFLIHRSEIMILRRYTRAIYEDYERGI